MLLNKEKKKWRSQSINQKGNITVNEKHMNKPPSAQSNESLLSHILSKTQENEGVDDSK